MKIKTKLPFALCILLFLVGCKSTVQLPNQLHPGMTKPEVIALMGEPISTMSPGNGVEVLKFKLTKYRNYRLAVPLHTDYVVRLVAGQVDAYGTVKDSRQFTPPAGQPAKP